ncbi:MAG: GH39 [uncultured Pyrinomonadaceae bacterium]|uniref:GH39 n=1 Tax=uncultured Pyrinomonadaceae bacterium TaxID=2283094 RepID=A0A6J4PR01_9BACT|nr:MAG: GH39 [uncultured Pyrinomonadaceae bacterium]
MRAAGIVIVILCMASAPAAQSLTQDSVRVNVNWGDVRSTATAFSYGLNVFAGNAPAVAREAGYGRNLAYMKAGLLRYHYSGLINDSVEDARGWADSKGKRWDAAKINDAMNAADGWAKLHGYAPERLINIPKFPAWMKTYSVQIKTKSGETKSISLLDRSEYDNFAKFCADLVRILNVEQKRGIKYFEATNERDQIYFVEFQRADQPDRLDELIEIYNRAAVAMKAVDPTIKVGGPAFTRGDLAEQVRRFVRGTLPNLDFVTFHFYASSKPADSDEAIFDRTNALSRHTRDIVKILREESPGRFIPAHVNEYNINYNYRNNEPRMRSHKGAVFDALSIIAAVDAGASATNAWNERDGGTYGKMDGDNNLRAGAHVYQIFNNYLVGERVAVSSSDERAVVTFAVKNRAKSLYSYLIVNRSPVVQSIRTNFSNWGTDDGAFFDRHQISAAGYQTEKIAPQKVTSGEFRVPEHSVTLLTIKAKSASNLPVRIRRNGRRGN